MILHAIECRIQEYFDRADEYTMEMTRQSQHKQMIPCKDSLPCFEGEFPISGAEGRSNRIQDHLPGQVFSDMVRVGDEPITRYSAELWTSAQRKASSIHEISYRACFKPQLAGFFIERFTDTGDLVYDPFGGRGTTVIEAGLLGRRVVQNDINPLSVLLTRPRFFCPGRGSSQ